ncbi:MAG: sensor histidine kinase, partial [Steroidobacteraceae bacterium]
AERGALELRLLARETELRFLRDQLDPHFLFNCLNSIAALIGSDAAGARRMCGLMADFFRTSLKLESRPSIALAEELAHIAAYLDIEQVRFGERLSRTIAADEGTDDLAVPPLILQPLVENAVHHGIAHLLHGGEIAVTARRRAGLLELIVENPCDPERPPSRSTGLGLPNVRARIERLFGLRGSIEVHAGAERFRVAILLPAVAAEDRAACAS